PFFPIREPFTTYDIANTPIFHSVKPHAQQSLHTPAGFIRHSVETPVFVCCPFRLWNLGEALLPLFEVAEMGLESPARPLWEIWGCMLCIDSTCVTLPSSAYPRDWRSDDPLQGDRRDHCFSQLETWKA